jgi:hypothetical protein
MKADAFELRLRCATIATFGLLFLLSYAFILLLLFDNPYVQGLIKTRLSDMTTQISLLLFITVLGVLMLTGVFKRKVFHAFAGFVLAYQLCSLCLSVIQLTPYTGLSNLDFFGGTNPIAWIIGGAPGFGFPADNLASAFVNFIFWCAPFALYYLILFIRKRRKQRKESSLISP